MTERSISAAAAAVIRTSIPMFRGRAADAGVEFPALRAAMQQPLSNPRRFMVGSISLRRRENGAR